jgi:ABC-type cobalamin/Fe3+-siderophores transport system ATPase subunit
MSSVEELRFPSIEVLVGALERRIHRSVPLPQYGSAASIRAFKEWFFAPSFDTPTSHRAIVVPPDPTGFLSFPTLRQEFELARSPSDPQHQALSIEQIGAEFSFDSSQLDQPIYSLSGGERTRAAIAKACLLLHQADSLVLCTPTHWLHLDSYSYLWKLLSLAKSLSKPVTLFLLEGDELGETYEVPAEPATPVPGRSVSWFFGASNYEIQLLNNAEPGAKDRLLRFDVSAIRDIELRSPTILTGRNGSGKSLLAKCLSDVVRASSPVTAKSKYGEGPARLVLQDTLSHLFRRPIAQHPSRIFEFDQEGKKKVDSIFTTLSQECRKRLWTSLPSDAHLVGPEAEPCTLFQAKLVLIAERLVYSPPLLVLDEPSWGLSVRQSDALIEAVVSYCHDKEVPIAMITHLRPKLKHYGNSTIALSRDGDSITAKLAS